EADALIVGDNGGQAGRAFGGDGGVSAQFSYAGADRVNVVHAEVEIRKGPVLALGDAKGRVRSLYVGVGRVRVGFVERPAEQTRIEGAGLIDVRRVDGEVAELDHPALSGHQQGKLRAACVAAAFFDFAVHQTGRIVAGEVVVRELRLGRIARSHAHGVVQAVDGQEAQ